MKLLVIAPYFYPALTYGGPITASYNLSKEVSSLGVEVSVVSTDANGRERLNVVVDEFVQQDGIKIKYCYEQIRTFFSFKMISSLYSDIKSSDILHVQAIYSYPTPLALIFAYFQNKNVLLSPRGSFSEWSFFKNGIIKKIWIKMMVQPFSKNIHWHATSTKEKDEILKFFPKAKIQLISDGVESVFKLGNKDKSNKWENSNYIATLGRIHSVKGYDIAIDAMNMILKKHPDLILNIAGEDYGQLQNLKVKVEKLGLAKSIHFVGNLSGIDKIHFLKNAKCLLVPSHTENFGIVVVESLSCQTPVIASKNTPWQSLEEYGAGLFIDNTADKFVESVLEILENENQFKKNTLILADQFRWDIIAKKYQQVLSSIIQE